MRRAASTSMHNLQELVDPGGSDSMQARIAALEAEETEIIDKTQRVIIVCNSLPLKMKADPEGAATRGHSWHFELDPDSIYGQSAGGILSGTSVEKVIFLGGLSSEVEIYEQDSVAADLADRFNCIPVFLGAELKEKHYKGFCKQFLWPLMHYVLPMSPQSPARYSKSNWQGYLAANKRFADKVVEVLNLTATLCGSTTTTSCSSPRSFASATTPCDADTSFTPLPLLRGIPHLPQPRSGPPRSPQRRRRGFPHL